MRHNALVRPPAHPGLQVQHLLRKVLGHAGDMRVQRLGRTAVASRRAAQAQVDAPRRQRVQHAEVLGHLEGRVVGQHHAGTADADAPGARGDGGHQHLRRRTDDGGHAVMLAHPEALVAQGLAMLGEFHRVAQRVVFTAPGAGHGLVEDGQAQAGRGRGVGGHVERQGFGVGQVCVWRLRRDVGACWRSRAALSGRAYPRASARSSGSSSTVWP